ncbi:MAG: MarR family transcriptional regulator [Ktedonobacterales bacterium]|nr:MarR family transcriptional regulator [Ktedonobacterales bacterium]
MEHPLGTSAPTMTERQLLRAFMHMQRAEWHERTVAGCTPSEVRVLMCIRHSANPHISSINVSQISRQLHVTSPAITHFLKGLEARGLVERHADVSDKRAVNFRLTAQGDAVVHQAADIFMASIRGLIAFMGEEQSAHLAELLSKAFYYFSERAALATDTAWNGETEQ